MNEILNVENEDVTKDKVSFETQKILHGFISVLISGNVDEEALECLYDL